MKLNILLTTGLLLFFSLMLQGQSEVTEENKEVVVQLNTGAKIKGEIVEWKLGEYIVLNTTWDPTFTVPDNMITEIISPETKELLSQYTFEEEGLYYSAKMNFIFGNEGSRANSANGLGGSLSAGWKFHRLLAAGVGVGYDRYIWKSGENLLPIFAEVSSYLIPKNNSLFVNVQAGYSLAFTDEQYLITDAKGGFLFYPSAGLRLGKSEARYTIDLGYKIQRAEFTYRDTWSAATHEQRLVYRRLSLRFGVLL